MKIGRISWLIYFLKSDIIHYHRQSSSWTWLLRLLQQEFQEQVLRVIITIRVRISFLYSVRLGFLVWTWLDLRLHAWGLVLLRSTSLLLNSYCWFCFLVFLWSCVLVFLVYLFLEASFTKRVKESKNTICRFSCCSSWETSLEVPHILSTWLSNDFLLLFHSCLFYLKDLR